MRQVTHALLTRPPLSSEKFCFVASYSTSHIRTPFDLHVLSTPPAFILSQDQTLKSSLILFRTTLAFLSFERLSKGLFRCPFGLYCFWGTISRLLRMKISNEFSGLSYCLIIKVHYFSLSSVLPKQLNQFTTVLCVCQALFWIILKILFFKTFQTFASFR